MKLAFPLLFLSKLGTAIYSCSETQKPLPYFLGSADGNTFAINICLSNDKSIIGMTGFIGSAT